MDEPLPECVFDRFAISAQLFTQMSEEVELGCYLEI
jgi:hypothetical protein